MNKGLYALAAGTFGLGIVEYVMMGILPDMANGLNISITQAGHVFSPFPPLSNNYCCYSPGGEMMGGAMVQLAFNLGNAVGAYFGGIPIDRGMGVEYASLVGATLAFAGVAILVSFNRAQRGKMAWA